MLMAPSLECKTVSLFPSQPCTGLDQELGAGKAIGHASNDTCTGIKQPFREGEKYLGAKEQLSCHTANDKLSGLPLSIARVQGHSLRCMMMNDSVLETRLNGLVGTQAGHAG